MVFRWRADDGSTLNAGLVAFQGFWTSIAKKPYIFVIFQRGGGPDPLSPLWICPWFLSKFKLELEEKLLSEERIFCEELEKFSSKFDLSGTGCRQRELQKEDILRKLQEEENHLKESL